MHYQVMPLILALSLCSGVSVHAENVTPTQPSASTDPSTPAMTGTIDGNAPGWIWSGMSEYTSQELKNGVGHTGGPGSYAAYTFRGTNVEVFGEAGPSVHLDGRSHRMGKAQVTIDGAVVTQTTMTAEMSGEVTVGKVTGLKDGMHVLQVKAVDGWIVVDYINVARSTVDSAAASVHTAGWKPNGMPFEGDYRLFPRNAPNKCLEAVTSKIGNGTGLEIFEPSRDRAQIWHVYDLGNDTYRIGPASIADQSICIPPYIAKDAQMGPHAVLWQYTSDASQVLKIVPVGNGFCKIQLADADRVLDVYQQKTDDGTPVLSWNYWGGPCQQWWFQPADQ